MTKPLKFYQTLNQAPRSISHGKHRRASPSFHGDPVVGTGDGPGGTDEDRTWVTFNSAGSCAFARSQPPTIPYAGIRTGELIGHRLWWVLSDHQISSLVHRRIWQPGETVIGDINEVVDDDPCFDEPIFGGIYAFADPKHYMSELRENATLIQKWRQGELTLFAWGWNAFSEATAVVAGTIKMWGEVVEHQEGYRAEFAKLQSLDALRGDGDLNALREHYGVPQ